MEFENQLLNGEELDEQIWKALIEKTPLPPENWSRSKLDNEVLKSTDTFEVNPHFRQKDALETTVYYLASFAKRMPERVNLTRSNKNVAEMCVRLLSEIERITFQPEKIIAESGKLKVLLVAILAAGTCWIYRNETERFIAEQELLKNVPTKKTESQRLDSNFASQLLRKVVLNRTEAPNQQGSLF